MELIPAPKDLADNIWYRRQIAEAASKSTDFQKECWIRAKRDIIWWFDTFCWTYSPKEYPDCPHRPFVTWKYQEGGVYKMNSALGHHDILIEKSRDMGASWLMLGLFTHRFVFFPSQSFLIGSRKEEYVDQTGDPDCLFWKIDYLLERLPTWMRPQVTRNALHIHNELNDSTIDGESTNDDFGRGGRRTAIFLDEFTAVPNGNAVLSATRDTTNSRFFNGTPRGARGAYYQTRQKMFKNAPDRILRFHWSMHPEKSIGLYIDPIGKQRSPWYDEQCARAANEQEIAQELDINYADSGWPFFDPIKLESIEARDVLAPMVRGEIDADTSSDVTKFMQQSGGRLLLWVPMGVDGVLHLDRFDYAIGCDIGTGKGGRMTSSSVASVVNLNTGEKVARFSSNQMSPTEFSEYVSCLGKLFTGKSEKPALVIWEDNGPGGEFGKHMISTLKYPNLFYREDETLVMRKKTRKPGWYSTKSTKRILLSRYAEAMVAGRYINRDIEAIRECSEYEHQPDGTIEHTAASDREDVANYGENHGDIVIADALACRALDDGVVVKKPTELDPPTNCFLARRQVRLREKLKSSSW